METTTETATTSNSLEAFCAVIRAVYYATTEDINTNEIRHVPATGNESFLPENFLNEKERQLLVEALDGNENWHKWPMEAMRTLAYKLGLDEFGLGCALYAWRFWQGGNQWSAWASYISFFRHVVKLPIDYTNWEHWEKLAIHSGPRFVHRDFCIICDRPEVLTVDNENRPNNTEGPFCQWRDGAALYTVRGVRIPAWIIEEPEKLTPTIIDNEANAEVRRIMIETYGQERYLVNSNAVLVHQDEWGKLYRKDLKDDEPIFMVAVVNSTPEPDGTFKDYFIRVHPELRPMFPDKTVGNPQQLTARNAVASTFGKYGHEYDPDVET